MAVAAEELDVPGLRYVSDGSPGVRRRRVGKGFSYTAPDGTRIADKATIERITKLAIPPAWSDVWISPAANGHILATGRDAKNRKQYRYHPTWRQVRDGAKFERTLQFAELLPGLRRRVRKDMSLTGLPKEKVVATVVALLDSCFARIGNETYARENGSFGLSTLRNKHAKFDASGLRLSYRGKSGKDHEAFIDDKRIVHIVRKCQEIPGQVLFQYVPDEPEDGARRPIASNDVNDYLREHTHEDFSAKDFRTWAATVICTRELAAAPLAESENERNRIVVAAIDEVAAELGNTRTVCRNSYIHPEVIAGYLDGSLSAAWERRSANSGRAGLRADERFTLQYLKSRMRRSAGKKNRAA